MSNVPDSNVDLDLHFLPAWAQQSSEVNRFANYEGDADGSFDRRRSDRGPRRDNRGGPRRDGPREARGGSGPNPNRDRGPGGPGGQRGPGDRGPAGGGGQRPMGQGQRGGPYRGGRPDRGDRGPERREPAQVLPEIEVYVVPEDRGVENLARQIKLTGRAYPLFDIGYLILKKPDRYNVCCQVIKKGEDHVAQPLFLCSIDETLWFSQPEAMDYILNKHFSTFYQEERIPSDPPKGMFTFVAQCGMSGVILGPPNYHDYQNKLRRLHAERYSHLPFEVYKSRVRIVKDEAVVKKWIDDQSFKTLYLCLNVPDPLKLNSREEVERHFRETHLANVVQSIESYTINGLAAQNQPNPALRALARRAFEEQRRFPLKLVTVLSQMFASQGLQFFKVNKSVTHVAVSRPHFLDLATTPVSDGVIKIINYINSTPGTTRRQMLEVLAPAPAAVPAETAPAPAAPAESAAPATDATPPSAPAAPAPATAEAQVPLTPMQNALIGDLHWLIHQGHVIEFANGVLETAKRPLPKPVRTTPAKEKSPAPAEVAAADVVATDLAETGADEAQAAADAQAPAETPAEAPAAEAQAPVAPAQETPAP